MLLLAACTMLEPSSDFPSPAVPMTPPAAYFSWWQATESCARRTGRFTRIRWYVVPGAMTFPTHEGPKVGLWSRVGDEVRIAVAEGYVAHELLVRYEMLHALLDREGHPPSISSNAVGSPGKPGMADETGAAPRGAAPVRVAPGPLTGC